MLALNIASRPFQELLHPLAYGQVAPVPFLWAERLMVMLFGVNEWALRALPLLAGGVLCIAVVMVARRMVGVEEALVALVLVGFSQALVRYSAEVKPYSLDALFAVATVGAGAALLERGDSWSRWRLLAAVGTVAILCSLTSVFVCLGVGLALVMRALREKRAYLLGRIALLALVWAGLFTVTYAQLYRRAAVAPYMRTFWEGAFLVPGSAHLLARARVALQEVVWGLDPGMALLGLGALTAVLMVLGAITLWRRGHPEYTLLLLVPGLAPFAASALGAYPIATRLILFATPLFIVLAAVGIMVTARALHRLAPRVPARWFATLLVFPAVITALTWAVVHERDQQMLPLVQNLNKHWHGGDAIYVYHRIVPGWLFYSTNWAAPDTQQLAWAMRMSGPGQLGHENGPSRGPRPPGEGDELAYDLSGRRVLLGTSSGVQGRPMFGYLPRQPDRGWAVNETRRMRAAAHPRVWIVLGNASHPGLDLGKILLEAVRAQGGTLVSQDSMPDMALYQFEFAPDSAS
jgi:4-amino-4-deoxy-L-arabinose transferase-like glycosyltransferase